jgi:hypothetical protein
MYASGKINTVVMVVSVVLLGHRHLDVHIGPENREAGEKHGPTEDRTITSEIRIA